VRYRLSLRFRRLSTGAKVSPVSNPKEIDDCTFWLDFSDSNMLFTDDWSTNVSSNDDLIYTAAEKVDWDAFQQATESRRPLWKTNSKNGLSTAYFNSDELRMTNTSILSLISENQGTFIVVLYPTYPYANDFVRIMYLEASDDTNYFELTNWEDNFGWGYGDNASANASISALPERWQILTCVREGADYYMYIDGKAQGSGAFGSDVSSGSGSLYMGDNWECVWWCGESIIYDRALSKGERLSVEAYLNNRWAIY
jgi:hypothetical protein